MPGTHNTKDTRINFLGFGLAIGKLFLISQVEQFQHQFTEMDRHGVEKRTGENALVVYMDDERGN